MATYAIGDVQGCYKTLRDLLTHIQFDNQKDTLWFTGDLVNRGPESLEVLRFIKDLGEKHISVLGNHDLHLLAVAYGASTFPKDTLSAVLTAPDKNSLLDWLRFRPMLHYDATRNYLLTHAGLSPVWTVSKAQQLAKELESSLRQDPTEYLLNMYGNLPDQWDDALQGMDRLRCITNYLTRMRYCYMDGRLNLTFKGPLAEKPANLMPWFDLPNRAASDVEILFGHWAALGGKSGQPNIYALDTGCVWGNCLTAMRLDDQQRFTVNCQQFSPIE